MPRTKVKGPGSADSERGAQLLGGAFPFLSLSHSSPLRFSFFLLLLTAISSLLLLFIYTFTERRCLYLSRCLSKYVACLLVSVFWTRVGLLFLVWVWSLLGRRVWLTVEVMWCFLLADMLVDVGVILPGELSLRRCINKLRLIKDIVKVNLHP